MPSPAEEQEQRPWWRRALAPVILAALVLALYTPSIRNGFLYDDYKLIVDQIR